MYTAAGLNESTFLAHSGNEAMLYMTPQKYRHTRSRNGTSWLMSCAPAPNLAMTSAAPTLKVACRTRVGISSSQYQVSGSPVTSTMANSTNMDSSSCWNSTSTYASGRQARGKCSARISEIFARMTVEPTTIDRSVKANMKTPVTR
jgi:hypothetical protein